VVARAAGAADRAVSIAVERRYGVISTLTGWRTLCAARRAAGRPRRGGCRHRAFLDHVEAEPKLPALVMFPLIACDGPFAAALARVLARMAEQRKASAITRARCWRRARIGRLSGTCAQEAEGARRQRRRLDDAAPPRAFVASDAEAPRIHGRSKPPAGKAARRRAMQVRHARLHAGPYWASRPSATRASTA